jgi:hypothetical protein
MYSMYELCMSSLVAECEGSKNMEYYGSLFAAAVRTV